MPFQKYLQNDDNTSQGSSGQYSNNPSYDDNARASMLGIDSTTFSNSVQFQIPQFMLNGPPTLAPGGGAEVLPAGMFNSPGGMASTWLSNNGFSTKFVEDSFSDPSSSRYTTNGEIRPEDEVNQTEYTTGPFDYTDNNDLSNATTTTADVNQTTSPSHSFNGTTAMTPGGSSVPLHMPLSAQHLLSLTTSAGLNAPSPLGLPVYSASGFDLLSILARVATRPHPKIVIGPVDLTCSFVVVDVRRYDRPIVYASPTFCQLTGYAENEVLGRNCRFLQAPDGNLRKGEERRFVAPETVQHLYKSVVADKECQASIINYRKGGEAFINLVTIVPVTGGLYNRPEEADEVVYQVGFQVDLTEQPNAILQRLRDGSYIVNYGAGTPIPPSLGMPIRDRRINPLSSNAVSKDLRALLADSSFLDSLPISTNTTVPSTTSATEKADATHEGNNTLNLLLLESAPDFIHVLSLKGSFLYVAPAVRRVLGFEPEELVGKSIADYCHPADLVPLMRELKESSVTPGTTHDGQTQSITQGGPGPPKTVDLLFRAQSKTSGYVWLECRGRLHVEPGKGRKAIILSGRARQMPSMGWDDVVRGGGLTSPVRSNDNMDGVAKDQEREFWGMLSVQGTFLVVGAGIRDVLGWGVAEIIGKALLSLVVSDGNGKHILEEHMMRMEEGAEPAKVICEMSCKDGRRLSVQVVVYRSRERSSVTSPSPTICQIKALESISSTASQTLIHPQDTNVFEELDTGRGSSWQYELQQLKFANQRLTEEVDSLEASLLSHNQHHTAASPITSHFPDHINNGLPVSRPIRLDNQDWGAPPHFRDYDAQRSLKRSWDSDSS